MRINLKRLEIELKKRKWTRSALARKAGITPHQFDNIFAGGTARRGILTKMAKALGGKITTEDLLQRGTNEVSKN